MERRRVALYYRTCQRLPGDYEEKLTELDTSEDLASLMYDEVAACTRRNEPRIGSSACPRLCEICEANCVSFSVTACLSYWLQNIGSICSRVIGLRFIGAGDLDTHGRRDFV